jgi:hypothetical protein
MVKLLSYVLLFSLIMSAFAIAKAEDESSAESGGIADKPQPRFCKPVLDYSTQLFYYWDWLVF